MCTVDPSFFQREIAAAERRRAILKPDGADDSIHIDPVMLACLNEYVANGRKRGRPSIARLKMSSKKRKRPEHDGSVRDVASLGQLNANMKRLKM
jgi:hypothetical protein